MNPDRAQEIVHAFSRQRVAVFGDLMLDRYIWGQASRISQEAPVPIVAVNRQTAAPGGAANVLRNIASLGGNAIALGVIGDDVNGDDLIRELEAQGIGASAVVRDADRKTTEKTRIIADHQQVVRVDVEEVKAIDAEQAGRLVDALDTEAERGTLQAIIVEDYNKGTVTETVLKAIVELATRHKIPVALDPHPGNPAHAEGFTIMTPNRAEAFAMAGVYPQAGVLPIEEDAALRDVVQRLQAQWKPEYLLITLGAHGMALFHSDDAPIHIPTQAREVYDVSGAGDTVIASFVLALLSGASPKEAAMISNHAAGVVVGKVGTAPVSGDELIHSFHQEE